MCEKLAGYFSYDNFGWVRWKLIQSLRSPWYLKHEGIITSDTLRLTLNTPHSGERVIMFLPSQSPKLKYTYKSSDVTGRKKDLYWYTIIPSDSLCYLQFNTMFDRHLLSAFGFFQRIPLYFMFVTKGIGYFDDYVDKMLEVMHEKGAMTLVVDLRGNGGGSSTLGDQLLYKLGVADSIRGFSTLVRISPLLRAVYPNKVEEYEQRFRERTGRSLLPDTLINTDSLYADDSTASDYFGGIKDKHSDYYTTPAKYPFKGKVYFITGEGTFSSASVLAATVKDNKIFTIVGQPTGQASHYGEVLILQLPKTGTYCTISCKKFLRPDGSSDNERAVYPDKEIWLSFEEFQNGVDPVFNWILGQVGSGK
ncbi:MAG: S41 family peptidase [Bacteroidetes bacterium]|nr:S41 family peptidase [Bacteroidota bacterium]